MNTDTEFLMAGEVYFHGVWSCVHIFRQLVPLSLMQDAINHSKRFINMQQKIRSDCEQSQQKGRFSKMISSQEEAQVSSQFSLISRYKYVNVFC